ncbi:MAG: hypothetical protein ACYCX3_03115 [Thermoleophilia bacterium]
MARNRAMPPAEEGPWPHARRCSRISNCSPRWDSWASGVRLLGGKPGARTLSLLAAGALVFLALYDFGWEAAIGFDRTTLDRLSTTIMDLWLLGLGASLALWRY